MGDAAVQRLAALGALLLLLLIGAFLNPVLTTLSLLIDRDAPRARATEAFGWLSTGLSAGSGLGSVVAAALTGPAHGETAFLITALFGTVALLLGVLVARGAGGPLELGRTAGPDDAARVAAASARRD